ncbi:MAG: tetratricopeptide repeat protein [Acidobacteriota bacterium]
MKNKQIVTAVAGTLVGFILGFFVSQVFVSSPAGMNDPQSGAPTQGASQVPPEHPTAEVMERLTELQSQAEAEPENGQVRISLANAYYDMGRFDGAIQWYEEALLLIPDDVNIRTDLGTAYLYTGNPVKAVELYNQSLETQPDHAQTLYNLGVTYLSTGQPAEALKSLQNLLDFHPDHPDYEAIQQQIDKIKETSPLGAPLP